ncbi:hypothetical protein BH09MYX1_BH09MYX1_04660 [soil metagenome]
MLGRRLGFFALSAVAFGVASASAAGCGSRTDVGKLDDDIAPTSTVDAGIDVKPVKDAAPDNHVVYVPKGTKCVRGIADPVPPRFTIPSSSPPPPFPRPPQVKFSGGPLLHRPTIIPMTFDGDDMRDEIEDFVASIGCSDYWRTVMTDYGVGDAVSGTPIHLTEKPAAKITDNQISLWLRKKIEAKEIPDPEDVIYAVYYPEETQILLDGQRSCQTFGAYHYELELSDGTKRAYAIMPRCRGFGGLSDLDELTVSSSHELTEASSDPFPSSDPAHQFPEPDGIAWSIASGSENADMCAFDSDAYLSNSSYPFTVQRVWSNSSAFKGLDPCVPLPAGDYFGGSILFQDKVTIDVGEGPVQATGMSLAVGATKTVQVRVFGGPGNIILSANDLAQSLGQPKSLELTLSKTNGVDGDLLTLTIKRIGTTSYGFNPFVIRSQKQGRDKRWFGLVGD